MRKIKNEAARILKVQEELQSGAWGQDIKRCYEELGKKEADMIARLLALQSARCGRHIYFAEALSLLFPYSDCYYHSTDKKFILCLPYPKDEANLHRWQLIRALFLDVTNRYDLFWEKHIGIIGTDSIMRIGKVAIYKT